MIALVVVLIVGSVFAQNDANSQNESVEKAIKGQSPIASELSNEMKSFEAEVRELLRPDVAEALISHLIKKPIPSSYSSCADVIEKCQVPELLTGISAHQSEFMECHPKNDHLHSLSLSFHALTNELDKKPNTVADLCVVPSEGSIKYVRKRLYDLDQSRCLNQFKQAMDYGGRVKSTKLCVLSGKIYQNNKNTSYAFKRNKCKELIEKMNALASKT